jgi:hypothetical protein
MPGLTLILVLLILIVVLAAHIRAAGGQGAGMLVRRIGGALLVLSAAYLAARGMALLAVPLGFLGLMLFANRAPFSPMGTATKTPGQASRVRTAFLEMALDHDTGEMSGHVLAGVYAGRDLASLPLRDLLVLWRECRAGDPQSRQLLEAYLDRTEPEWRGALRENERGNGWASGKGSGPARRETAAMTREEAYDVLGLEPGAAPEDVRSAHRNLMKRLHPDQGGSNYLAAKINEAKAVLLSGEA